MRRAVRVRLEVDRDEQPVPPRRRDDERQRASSAEPRPHHETTTSSMPADAICVIWRSTTAGSLLEYGPSAGKKLE